MMQKAVGEVEGWWGLPRLGYSQLWLTAFVSILLLAACRQQQAPSEPSTATAVASGVPAPTAPAASAVQAPATSPPTALPSAAAATWQLTDPKFAPLPNARALYGTLGGSVYEIEIPTNWNHELVMYAHGFRGSEPFLLVGPPEIRRHLIETGFAWAASSFSSNGYDPEAGVDDTLALLNYFKSHVAQPSRIYIDGTSMGGHVVIASLEEHPGVYSGALSLCGAVAGVAEMDYLVSYEAVAQYLAGLQLLPPTNVSAYEQGVTQQVIPALGGASGKVLTEKGLAFESVMEYLTGGSRPFREQGFMDRFTANFEISFDELQRHTLAARAGTNVDVQYHIAPGFGVSDSQLNRGVYRLPADPSVRNAQTHPAYAPVTGDLTVPMLTLHTTGDALVPFSMEQDLRRLVDAAGKGDLLVQRAIRRPDHCQFTDTEMNQAWDDLVAWVERGVKPEGDNVLAPDLSQIGLRWTQPLLPGDPGGL